MQDFGPGNGHLKDCRTLIDNHSYHSRMTLITVEDRISWMCDSEAENKFTSFVICCIEARGV